MRISLQVLVLLFCVSHPLVFANTELLGVWEAGGRAHAGFLKFSSTHVEFSLNGKRWECKTPYEIVATGTDETFAEEEPPLPKGVRPWSYVKLRLGKSKCTDASHFVFAFFPDQPNYAGFVKFRDTHKWSGTGHFHRVTPAR